MRICLITGIFPPDIGGPATYVAHFAQSLAQRGHDVVVVTLGDGVTDHPFPVTRISRAYPWPVRLCLVFAALLRNGWRSEAWYINGLELPAVLAGKLLRKRMVMKIVSDYAWERAGNQGLTTDSVLEFQTKRQHWKVELHKALRAWLARQVKAVITPSQHVQRLVCGWGTPAERVQVVYNAIEDMPAQTPGTKLDARRSLNLPESAFLIITIGRLIALKGIDALIRAIAWLQQNSQAHEEYQLLIVGDGPEKNNLTELARALEITNRIRCVGQVDRRTAMQYLRAADLFVLNSSTEGFSHVILEAMIVGTPVIATNVGGNPELVRHQENGLLIQVGDFEVLTAQIQNVLHDSDLQARIIRGGKDTAQQFSWERLFQQTIMLLGDNL